MSRRWTLVGMIVLGGILVACGGDGSSTGDPDTTQDTGTPPPDLGPAPDPGPVEDTAPPPPAGPGAVTLSIDHVFDGQPLALGTDVTAPDGTTLQINVLRYWLSNVQWHQADGSSHVVPASYYLFEQTAENTRNSLTIADIPAGDYTGFTMAVGVDKEHNHSTDVFEGELSTAVEMDWGWNSGFIFFKIEGEFDDNGAMTFFKAHVGKDDLYREVTLTFDAPITIDDAHQSAVQLSAEVKTIFNGWNVSSAPSIVGGPTNSPAGNVGTNYSQWFSLLAATSEE
jgi:hypothetical protein